MDRILIVRCVHISAANYFLKTNSSDPLIKFFISSTSCVRGVSLWFWILRALIERYQDCAVNRGVPVTLKYDLFSVWTEIFFDVKIFNFLKIRVNEVFSKYTFRKRNGLDIVYSIGRSICLIFRHCDNLLKYIESSKFRIVHIFIPKIIWQHKCDWIVFGSKVFRRRVCVRLFYNSILFNLAVWSIDHDSQLESEQKDNERKYECWD